jgi:hypothetical protein
VSGILEEKHTWPADTGLYLARVLRIPPWLIDQKRPAPRFRRISWLWLRLRWALGGRPGE